MAPDPQVLLVVDLQHGIVEPAPDLGPRSNPALTTNVPRILQAWRRLQWPIIHLLHHDSDPDHHLNKNTHPATHQPHSSAAPQGDEPVLLKTTGSAFANPDLQLARQLRQAVAPSGSGGGEGDETKQVQVVVIGMDGAQCVNDNTRGGYDHGFEMYVVADACATFGMPHYRLGCEAMSAEDTHVAAMSMLANGFATVLTTDELLARLPS